MKMADCDYWKNAVAKLRNNNECNWASQVLSTSINEKGSNLNEALKCVSVEEIIENAIFAYEDWDAQPYCDEILWCFEKQKIAEIFKQIENPSKNMKKGISRFFEL